MASNQINTQQVDHGKWLHLFIDLSRCKSISVRSSNADMGAKRDTDSPSIVYYSFSASVPMSTLGDRALIHSHS